MSNVYEGDPAVNITLDGAEMTFVGGQPVMDGGLENAAKISLFTDENWVGNILYQDPAEQVGSTFEAENKKAITADSLTDRRDAGNKALAWMVSEDIASDVQTEISNPTAKQIDATFLIQPPADSVVELRLSNNANNWKEQAQNPAHRRY